MDREQHIVHGLAWVATYAETLREVRGWARALADNGKLGETEQLLCKLLAAEYGAQLSGGVPMTQLEIVRPSDFGVAALAADDIDRIRLAFSRCAETQAPADASRIDVADALVRLERWLNDFSFRRARLAAAIHAENGKMLLQRLFRDRLLHCWLACSA